MEFRKRSECETDSQEDSDYETTRSKRKLSLLTTNYDDDLTRKRPRCFTRNALMARENRLRKKMYVESLERNMAKLTQENRKLKTNSTDITTILRSIHHNTGMLVGTSLDKSLSFTSYVSKKQSDCSLSNTEDLLSSVKNEIDFGDLFNDPELLQIEETNVNNTENTFEEHNYISRNHNEGEEDVGVCLHVSKHRVSLEFCSKCNDEAAGVWKNDF
nr:probable basic-leucine zipper transcription factor D isoform X2 [Onthophagus taurus]